MVSLPEATDRDASGDPVSAVRAFSRFYTRVLGLLSEGLLRTPYSLTEARLIFELAQGGAVDVAELRRTLDIDAGYLSRLLSRLEQNRILVRERSLTDGRRQVARLTGHGRSAFRLLDRRSADEVRALLAPLTEEERRRLTGAMGTIQALLGPEDGRRSIVIRPPWPGDLGWMVHRHGVLYSDEFGWDETFEALVARIVADYGKAHDPARESVWIGEVDGERAGCVMCTRQDERVAKLRLLLVEPRARGVGLGTRLIDECVRFARRAGYRELTLWTNDVLVEARRLYERAGFELVQEDRHHSFGHELVGQDWRLAL